MSLDLKVAYLLFPSRNIRTIPLPDPGPSLLASSSLTRRVKKISFSGGCWPLKLKMNQMQTEPPGSCKDFLSQRLIAQPSPTLASVLSSLEPECQLIGLGYSDKVLYSPSIQKEPIELIWLIFCHLGSEH